MITADQVVPLLLDACPSFADIWERIENENGPADDYPERLHYVDAGEFARHLVNLHKGGEWDEVRRSFEVIERLHVDGDDYVRELATIGYLEDVQNVAGHAGIDHEEFVAYLGPESRAWWQGLNAFWSGEAPLVQRSDE